MDTRTYNTEIEIALAPVSDVSHSPLIWYKLGNQSGEFYLTENTVLKFNQNLNLGEHCLEIGFANKTNDTPQMAVEIKSVTIEGMTLDRFKWAGKYYPIYPEPWASEQTEPLPECHESATYLGWNGRWILEFTAPIFVWVHQTENLGWRYD